MSDSSGETSTDVRVDSEFEETAEVLSEESGGVVTETRPVETDEEVATADVAITGESAEDAIDKPGWVPLAVGVLLVVAIAAVAIILLLRTGSPQVQLGEAGEIGVEEQANWRFKAKTVGGKHPSGKHPPAPKKETQAIQALVRNWHDALILSPGKFSGTTNQYFAPPAGNAITSSDFGLPKSANEVETTKRRALIAIEADGAKRAVVDVTIVARGMSDKGEFRTESETTLWLERAGSKWTVIGFEADQKSLPLNPKADKGKPAPGDKPGDKSKKKPDAPKAGDDKKGDKK